MQASRAREFLSHRHVPHFTIFLLDTAMTDCLDQDSSANSSRTLPPSLPPSLTGLDESAGISQEGVFAEELDPRAGPRQKNGN